MRSQEKKKCGLLALRAHPTIRGWMRSNVNINIGYLLKMWKVGELGIYEKCEWRKVSQCPRLDQVHITLYKNLDNIYKFSFFQTSNVIWNYYKNMPFIQDTTRTLLIYINFSAFPPRFDIFINVSHQFSCQHYHLHSFRHLPITYLINL